ncbi:phage tail protein [Shewanella surugensis]|uniref:Phage tail protein n=1 Tax=Shewanella surugensis TaxID=212020 RepID=A0ABT0L8Z7_9GAMM|nr:phage tail protein [Shewanella surugensis]MCL1124169.1 phage tail protein [Shewanella surugensis]
MATMLSLGGFKFSVDTAAYNELTKTYEWRWKSQSRIGQSDLLQYTGKAANKVQLNGVIATTLNNVGTKQIDKLVSMADEVKPNLLVSGTGDVLGYWCITRLNQVDSKFVKGGLPRQQTFNLELVFYGDDIQN